MEGMFIDFFLEKEEGVCGRKGKGSDWGSQPFGV